MLAKPMKVEHAGRIFWQGHLYGQPVVLALSRIGKVAAAITATALIERFGIDKLVFTGVAGGLRRGVDVGDVVVATEFMQHDLDSSPLYPRYEVPLYGQTKFKADAALTAMLSRAAHNAMAVRLSTIGGADYAQARVHEGLLATGDRFVCGAAESQALLAALAAAGHDVLAVEMECAAVAQVCHDYGIAFAAMRTISDRAEDTAHVDFPRFLDETARGYAQSIIIRFLVML